MRNWIIVLLIFIIPLGVYAYLDTKTQSALMCSVASEKAQKEHKARLVKFSSPMCSECKEVAQEMNKVSKELKDSIVVEEINVIENNSASKEYNKSMIKKYNVTLVPTLVFLDKDGKLIKRQEGLMKADEITKTIERIK